MHLVDHAQLQMVLKVLAQAGDLDLRRDSGGAQRIAPADAGMFKDLHRADRARRKHGLAGGADLFALALMVEDDAAHLAVLDHQPLDLGAG